MRRRTAQPLSLLYFRLTKNPYCSSQLRMRLPQELLDEILSYLPLDDEWDEQSLRNCSLVAKSWVDPMRRRPFKTVEI